MVCLPGCCLETRNWQHDESICVRCASHYQTRTLHAVWLMTKSLSPGPARRLWKVLQHERVILAAARRDHASVSTDDGTREASNLEDTVRWRLTSLCASIPEEIQAEVLRSFVDGVVATLNAPPSLGSHSKQSKVSSDCFSSRSRQSRDLLALSIDSPTKDIRIHQATSSLASCSLRWTFIIPVVAASCKDFQAARKVLCKFRDAWKIKMPADRLHLENLIAAIVMKLKLDKEDSHQLLQDIGLAKASGSCSWFPCRIFW